MCACVHNLRVMQVKILQVQSMPSCEYLLLTAELKKGLMKEVLKPEFRISLLLKTLYILDRLIMLTLYLTVILIQG